MGFLANGASFLVSLMLLRPNMRAPRGKGNFVEGLHYVRGRPDLVAILFMLFFIGTFDLNFPIFVSTMGVRIFHADADGYGLLSSSTRSGQSPAHS